MDAPQNSVWGPPLWTILHTAAERFGSIMLRYLPKEEQRIWGGLLMSLRYSLPCPQCKKHYTDYVSKHPIIFQPSAIREWLYQLHSEVNQRLGRANSLTLEEAQEYYRAPIPFASHSITLQKEMVKAIRLGHCTREDIQRTIRFLEELKRFYNF
jgi:hypothetical protein